MNPIVRSTLIIVMLFPVLKTWAAEISGFVGYSSMQVAPNMSVKLVDGDSGKIIDIDETNFFGKYSFEGIKPGYYKLQVGDLTRELMLKKDGEDKRIDIDLSSKGGAMDYGKGTKQTGGQSGGNPVAQTMPNNQALANQIAGIWWGYAGSTERKIGLCPGGAYQDYTESSYSGGAYSNQGSAWGVASQGGGSGSWSIQGDTQSGVISVRYNSGATTSLNYRQINDPGCLDINGSTLCRTSATCQ